jgi:hypothetical protein
MKTAEFASFLTTLRNSVFGQALKTDAREGLDGVIALFQRLPEESLKSYVKMIENSWPRTWLVNECKAFRKSGNGNLEELLSLANSLVKIDLFALLKRLEVKRVRISAKKEEYLNQLRDWLLGVADSEPSQNGQASSSSDRKAHEPQQDNADTAHEIEEGFELFSSIKNNLDNLDYPEIRQEFEPLKRKSSDVLRGILDKLEMSTTGSRQQLESKLLSHLEFQRHLIDQAARI